MTQPRSTHICRYPARSSLPLSHPRYRHLQIRFWFDTLGLPHHYFAQASVTTIAKHIESFQAAKVLAKHSGHAFDINLRQEEGDCAMFMCRSLVGKNQVGVCLRPPHSRRHCGYCYDCDVQLSCGCAPAISGRCRCRSMPSRPLSYTLASHLPL